MSALVRFFCVVMPTDTTQIGLSYLKAIAATGIGVRAVSIGVSLLNQPPWDEVGHLFTSPLANRFINVICAPPGLYLGQPTTASQAGPEMDLEVTKKSEKGRSDEVIYKPKTALEGLYTVGIPNIAITVASPGLSESEKEALRVYKAVVCPTKEDMDFYKDHSVDACYIQPTAGNMTALLAKHHQ